MRFKMTFSIIFANELFSNFLLKSCYVNLPFFLYRAKLKAATKRCFIKIDAFQEAVF